MLFRSLAAPFARGLLPRGWVSFAVMGALALGQSIVNRKNRQQDRKDWFAHQEGVRERRAAAASQFNDRIAGLEGIDLGKAASASFTPQAPPVAPKS